MLRTKNIASTWRPTVIRRRPRPQSQYRIDRPFPVAWLTTTSRDRTSTHDFYFQTTTKSRSKRRASCADANKTSIRFFSTATATDGCYGGDLHAPPRKTRPDTELGDVHVHRRRTDFFGEPVTFFLQTLHLDGEDESLDNSEPDNASDYVSTEKKVPPESEIELERDYDHDIFHVLENLDGFILGLATRGQSCPHRSSMRRSKNVDEAEQYLSLCSHEFASSWLELVQHAYTACIKQDQHKKSTAKLFSPMVAATALAPLYIELGHPYAQSMNRRMTHVLQNHPSMVSTKSTSGGSPLPPSPWAQQAAAYRHHPELPIRERMHLTALHQLILQNDPYRAMHGTDRQHQHFHHDAHIFQKMALGTYRSLLATCPGDVLALYASLMLCHVLGDGKMASTIAASVATYWKERGGASGVGNPLGAFSASYVPVNNPSGGGGGGSQGGGGSALPGHQVASSWIALGLSAHLQSTASTSAAEHLANTLTSSTSTYKVGSGREGGAVASWALSNIYDADGRASEGVSALAGHDGIEAYVNSNALFWFGGKLAGRFAGGFLLDRDGLRCQAHVLRLFDENYHSVLAERGLWGKQQQKQQPKREIDHAVETSAQKANGPLQKTSQPPSESTSTAFSSMMQSIFGKRTEPEEESEQVTKQQVEAPKTSRSQSSSTQTQPKGNTKNGTPSLSPEEKEVLVQTMMRMPPTPAYLADATLLLLRMTLSYCLDEDTGKLSDEEADDFSGGVRGGRNERWVQLRDSWRQVLRFLSHKNHTEATSLLQNSVLQCQPLADVTSALALHDLTLKEMKQEGSTLYLEPNPWEGTLVVQCRRERWNEVHESIVMRRNVKVGLAIMGQLLDLGGDGGDSESNVTEEERREGWKMVVQLLAPVVGASLPPSPPPLPSSSNEDGSTVNNNNDANTDGSEERTPQAEFCYDDYHSPPPPTANPTSILGGFMQDVRPIIEHAICYAALQSQDDACRLLARAISAEGATHRITCPEVWWRYGETLEALGDEVAAEDAREVSVSFGGSGSVEEGGVGGGR